MFQAGGAAGSSARDWLLYETHPGAPGAAGGGRQHGDAFVQGDMKIIRWDDTNPGDENGAVPHVASEGPTGRSLLAPCPC
jgi:hypothetical protein